MWNHFIKDPEGQDGVLLTDGGTDGQRDSLKAGAAHKEMSNNS